MPVFHAQRVTVDRGGKKIPMLAPAYRSEIEIWNSLKPEVIGEVKLKYDITKNLYSQLHAVTMFVFDVQPHYQGSLNTYDDFREWVSLKIGWVRPFGKGRDIHHKARSWEHAEFFDDMEFRARLYNPALDFYEQLINMPREDILFYSKHYTGIQFRRLRG